MKVLSINLGIRSGSFGWHVSVVTPPPFKFHTTTTPPTTTVYYNRSTCLLHIKVMFTVCCTFSQTYLGGHSCFQVVPCESKISWRVGESVCSGCQPELPGQLRFPWTLTLSVMIRCSLYRK